MKKVKDPDGTMVPWYYQLNPCDPARYKVLALLGDGLAKLATTCACCNGLRMVGYLVAGVIIGTIFL